MPTQDPDQCSASLKPHLAHFLVGGLASGEDLTVIHATLQLCNAAVHHQPKLATPFLNDPILPALLNVVTLKVCLIGTQKRESASFFAGLCFTHAVC